MMKDAAAVVQRYTELYAATGADPEACANLMWAKNETEQRQGLSYEGLIDTVLLKIRDGSATYTWFYDMLAVLWVELSDDQRLYVMNILAEAKRLAYFLSPKRFPHKIDGRAKAAVLQYLRDRNAPQSRLRDFDG